MHRAYERPGVAFPAAQLWQLAGAWYGDRLDPDWQPRSPEENQAILDRVGLTGAFWQLENREPAADRPPRG